MAALAPRWSTTTATTTRQRQRRTEGPNGIPLSGMPRPRSTFDDRVPEQGAANGAAAEPGAAPAGPSTTHPDAGCSDEYVAFAARVGGGGAGIWLRRDESICKSGQTQNTFRMIRKQ